jgi:hypothetical protein
VQGAFINSVMTGFLHAECTHDHPIRRRMRGVRNGESHKHHATFFVTLTVAVAEALTTPIRK